jgi:L-asparaginase
MFIRFITTGGTIDKIYFDALSQFEVGDSLLKHILTDGLVDFALQTQSLISVWRSPPCKRVNRVSTSR